MGYYVRALDWKKSEPRWKLQFVSHKKTDTRKSAAKKPKKEWDIGFDRLRPLGFHSRMTIEEAKARARQLNAQAWITAQEERVQQKRKAEHAKRRKRDASLPPEFVVEFEQRFLRVRDSETKEGRRKKSRALILWSAAQRLIATVPVDPTDWYFHTFEIYDYFSRNHYSIRYTRSILRIANLWGFFISKKLGHHFLPVPPPRGFERMRIIEASFEKTRRARKASEPLLPEELERVRGKLNRQNFNWLFLSVWFGLRPKEVDDLKNPELWYVEKLPNGRRVLWIYQTKIVALPHADRWKPIPILFEQQEFGLRIIQSGRFRRPVIMTMRRHFGIGVDLYGGRKGFSDLMLSKGHTLENISIWMGHSTLDRTWRSYKSRTKFHL